jgi:hypothetical protein
MAQCVGRQQQECEANDEQHFCRLEECHEASAKASQCVTWDAGRSAIYRSVLPVQFPCHCIGSVTLKPEGCFGRNNFLLSDRLHSI